MTITSTAVPSAFAAPADPDGRHQPGTTAAKPPPPRHPSSVEPAHRDQTLGKGWQQSGDRMWTTSSDATGFHVLVAEASTGYQWRTAATLSEDGIDTEQWIGNACLTASGKRVVVVYAPRAFTNQQALFDRGGFTAVVDLTSGVVRKLPVRTSLAYFNPGCGNGENAVLTQAADEDLGKTGLLTLDAETGALGKRIEVPGQLTSAVPTKDGIVAADKDAVVHVEPGGRRTVLADTAGVPFRLSADSAGGVVFMDRDRDPATVRVRRAASVSVRKAATTTLAAGKPSEVGLSSGAGNKVFVTGRPGRVSSLPAMVGRVEAPAQSAVSTLGEAVVTKVEYVDPQGAFTPADPNAKRLDLTAKSTKTGTTMQFTVDPGDALTPRSQPDDPGRSCSVPRNDPKTQVYQPKPKQVEWAADMAVKNHLYWSRPANWKSNGLPGYSPQDMFPPVALHNTANGQVPAQVLLGILGQESNLWQASRHVLPGETGNPLVGNYYGTSSFDGWDIHFENADCGYGVSQLTDGMRLAGHEKLNETALPWTMQKAVATDYAANVAAGLQLLEKKWNEVQDAGITLNNNDPAKPENWFYAVWAYNSGYHQPGEDGSAGAYGLGWGNNPANPHYPPDREAFGTDPADFAHPQQWGYPEKVMGFGANPPSAVESPIAQVPMFRAAWWNGTPDSSGSTNPGTATQNKRAVQPPPQQFCSAANQCYWGQSYVPDYPGDSAGNGDVRGEPAGPCSHKNGTYYDLKCWWHDSSTWKPDCSYTCGNEYIRYDYPDYQAEPGDGTSYPPHCGVSELPQGSIVVDDVADDVPPVSTTECFKPNNAGTFSMTFGTDSAGNEASKIDLHQEGGGFGAHFWFSHTNRDDTVGNKLKITGTWAFSQQVTGWHRLFVHIPDNGAQTRQAKYLIDLGNGQTRSRVLPQRIQANKWVSLGTFPFSGSPKVILDNLTADGRNVEDVAWDAVAIAPEQHKPANIIVSMGDSYSSGEGASATGGTDYLPETDIDGANAGKPDSFWRDACHRSTKAWSRVMTLHDSDVGVGWRADNLDPDVDYRQVACSGARVANMLSSEPNNPASGGYGEVSQLDSGWIDVDTTLVTLSIGGNDARFTDVIEQCIELVGCQGSTLDGDSGRLEDVEPVLIENVVRPSVEKVLAEIHSKAPSAKIVLVGYPRLLSGDGYCIPGIVGDGGEAPWLNSMADKLNEQLNVAVQHVSSSGVQIKFADPTGDFYGKSVCGSPELIHGIVTDKTPGDDPDLRKPSAQSFHPKIEGAATYAGVVNRTLRDFGI
ncbi:GDSL-type esterase/lipase family protein [Amycolatopsis australiensis]|uniref:golvesin C-terminal-like domain-containing protein n=1 Tax=Amycolatopsis australiensis TaxID=546364 RepID=UPI0015A6075A|nr:GDSL-type esterase/lipase family protein [Amycolatopsis australiensis]